MKALVIATWLMAFTIGGFYAGQRIERLNEGCGCAKERGRG